MCAMKTATSKSEPVKADIITPAVLKPFAAGEVWEMDNNPDLPEWLQLLRNCKSPHLSVQQDADGEPARVILRTGLGDVSFIQIPRELTPDDSRTFFTADAPGELATIMRHVGPIRPIMDFTQLMPFIGVDNVSPRLVRFSESRDGVTAPRLTAIVGDWLSVTKINWCGRYSTPSRKNRDDDKDQPDVETLLRMIFGWRRTECADRLESRDFDLNDIVWDLACAVDSLTEELKATKRTWREPARRG